MLPFLLPTPGKHNKTSLKNQRQVRACLAALDGPLLGVSVSVNWWAPIWCNCVSFHDSTGRESAATNACGHVNKSSRCGGEKSCNNNRFFFHPGGWVTIQREERPRSFTVEQPGINYRSAKSHLTIALIDEVYPAEKGGSLLTWFMAAICARVLYFHRLTSSLPRSPETNLAPTRPALPVFVRQQ